MAEIIRGAKRLGKKILFVAHRRELIWQTRNKLNALGIEPKIIMGTTNILYADPTVHVATIQSVSSPHRQKKLPAFDVIIIDEAHRATARSYLKLVELYPNAILLGMTATPVRTDGRGLGYLFKHMVQGPTIPDLIDNGYLVKPKYYGPYIPNLKGVRVQGGEYVSKDLERVMDTSALIGDIIEWWLKLASGRKTIVFASSVAHSMHIADMFNRAGISAAHVDGTTPIAKRDAIFKKFRTSDEITVLTNCDVTVEGTDIPEVSCIVVARPTKSLVRWVQMIGRGLRTAPNKEDCVVLDHSGSVYNFGFVEDWNEWRLDDSFKDVVINRKKKEGESTVTCPFCKAVIQRKEIVMTPMGPVCPACMKVLSSRYRKYEDSVEQGELALLERNRVRRTSEKRQQFYAELRWIQEERGYKLGWVAYKYKARFKEWPPNHYRTLSPAQPTALTKYLVRQLGNRPVDNQPKML